MTTMGAPAQKPQIDTCNSCGKLFPRISIRLCRTCARIDENRFTLVRQYLAANNGAPLAEIAQATGVTIGDVRRFTDSGRLIEIETDLDHCTCSENAERCRYCRSQLARTFQKMEREIRQEHLDEPKLNPQDDRTRYVRRIRRIGENRSK